MRTPTLPAPSTDWQAAPCTQEDPQLWFPHPALERDPEYAAALCDGCPLTERCLALADEIEGWKLAEGRWGIWAGLTPEQRAARYRKGRRLTPCGTPAAYVRHLDHGEKPCEACREANAAKSRRRQP